MGKLRERIKKLRIIRFIRETRVEGFELGTAMEIAFGTISCLVVCDKITLLS